MVSSMQSIADRVVVATERLVGSPPPPLLAEPEARGPDFMCIGAQKAGTQWLYDQLQHHPDFWMPPIKELHYFNRGVRRRRVQRLVKELHNDPHAVDLARERRQTRRLEPRDLDFLEALLWLARRPEEFDLYARLFNLKGDRVGGDITPAYSSLNERLVRGIAGRFPHLKVVFLARDPIDRFWSRVCMAARREHWPVPFRWEQVVGLLGRPATRARSSPSAILKRWRSVMPAEQVGLYFFDDLRRDPEDLRRRVITFLGGDPGRPSGTLPAGFNRKAGRGSHPMPDEFRVRLVEHFAPELRASALELGGAAAHWPAKYGL